MAQPVFTPGRTLLTVANVLYSMGAYLADFNETHVYNPRWPPHARFHNGQTMSLGVLLAASSLYFAFKPALSGSKVDARDSMFNAAAIGSLYCLAGLTAILYPGTDWKDPDITIGGRQRELFMAIPVMMWVGYWLEVRRIGKAELKKA